MNHLERKFKAYSNELGMSEPRSLEELVTLQTDFRKYKTFLQYLGFSDANKRDLYEGDVIELMITKEMLDIHKNGFANSNLGKYIIAEKNITSVICEIVADINVLSIKYNLYCLHNGEILRDEQGCLIQECFRQEDSNFPQYLIAKGAIWIGNTIETPDLLQSRGQIWDLHKNVERCYITIESKEEMFELINYFDEENIIFTFPNMPSYGNFTDFVANIHQAYNEGYRLFLYEKEEPFQLKPTCLRYKDTHILDIDFKNFKYSTIAQELYRQKDYAKDEETLEI